MTPTTPEKEAEQSAFIERMKQARPSTVVRVPWGSGREENEPNEVRLRPLTVNEQLAAAADATAALKKIAKSDADQEHDEDDPGHARMFADEFRTEVLYRACRKVEDPKYPAIMSPAVFRTAFTTDELDALFKHYLTVCSELGPFRDSIPDDELDEWLEQLARDGSAFSFDLLGPDAQKTILLYAAFRIYPAAPSAPAPDTDSTNP